MSEFDRLKSDIDELVPGMVAMRRDLHEHPELAFEEVRTSGIVGAKNPEKGANYPHHHPRFNIDEDSMPIAAEVLARTALDYLK